jgi:hypothetical protein
MMGCNGQFEKGWGQIVNGIEQKQENRWVLAI